MPKVGRDLGKEATVVAMVRAGSSYRAIGRALGITETRVWMIFHRWLAEASRTVESQTGEERGEARQAP